MTTATILPPDTLTRDERSAVRREANGMLSPDLCAQVFAAVSAHPGVRRAAQVESAARFIEVRNIVARAIAREVSEIVGVAFSAADIQVRHERERAEARAQ